MLTRVALPPGVPIAVLLTLSDPRGGVLTPTDPRTAANKGGFNQTPPETN